MKYKPDQRVKILQIEIALPDPAHDCLDGELEDEIAALLTESGVFNPNSFILDWRYLNYGKERHAVAQPDTEENEIFLGKPDTAIEEIIARLVARRYKGLDDPVHSLTYRDVAQALAAQLDHLPEAVALSQDWPKLLATAIEATRLVSAFQAVEDDVGNLINEDENRSEVRLREGWLADGVSISRQQEVLEDVERKASPQYLGRLFPPVKRCCVCQEAILSAHGDPHWMHEEGCPGEGCDCDLYAHPDCCKDCASPDEGFTVCNQPGCCCTYPAEFSECPDCKDRRCAVCKVRIAIGSEFHWIHETDCPNRQGDCDQSNPPKGICSCSLWVHPECCACGTIPEQSEDGWLETAFEDRISGMEM